MINESQFLFFDIETIPNQSIKPPEFDASLVKTGNLRDAAKIEEKVAAARVEFQAGLTKKMSLDADYCQIVSIAWTLCDDAGAVIKTVSRVSDKGDRDMIDEFVSYYNDAPASPRIVTWNGKGFDIPVVWKRSVINGTKPIVNYDRLTNKYSSHAHIDLMHWWTNYNYGKLVDCARTLGLDAKTGMDGSMIYDAYKAGEFASIKAYNLQDVNVMIDIAVRFGIIGV